MDQDGQRSYLSSRDARDDLVSDHDLDYERIQAGISEEELARLLKDMDAELEERGPGETYEQTSDDDPVDAYGFPLSERPSRRSTLNTQEWVTSEMPEQQNVELVNSMTKQETFHSDSPSQGYEKSRAVPEAHVNAVENSTDGPPTVPTEPTLEPQPSAASVFHSAREEGSEDGSASAEDSEDDEQLIGGEQAEDTNDSRSNSSSHSDEGESSAGQARSAEMREQAAAAAVLNHGTDTSTAVEAKEHTVDASQEDELLSSRPTSQALAEPSVYTESDSLKTANVASEDEIHVPISPDEQTPSLPAAPYGAQDAKMFEVAAKPISESSEPAPAVMVAQPAPTPSGAPLPSHQGAPRPSEPRFVGAPFSFGMQGATHSPPAPFVFKPAAQTTWKAPQNQSPFEFGASSLAGTPNKSPFVFGTAAATSTPQPFSFNAVPTFNFRPAPVSSAQVAPEPFTAFGLPQQQPGQPAVQPQSRTPFVFNFPAPTTAGTISLPVPAQVFAFGSSPQKPFENSVSAPDGLVAIHQQPSPTLPLVGTASEATSPPEQLVARDLTAPEEPREIPDPVKVRDWQPLLDGVDGLPIPGEVSDTVPPDSPAPPQIAEETFPNDMTASEPADAEEPDGEQQTCSSGDEDSGADGEGSAESESDHEHQDGNALGARPEQAEVLAAPPLDPDTLRTELQPPLPLTTTSTAGPEAAAVDSKGSEGSEEDGESSAESDADNELEQESNASPASPEHPAGLAAPSLDLKTPHTELQPPVPPTTTSAAGLEATESESESSVGSEDDDEGSAESNADNELEQDRNASSASPAQAERFAAPSFHLDTLYTQSQPPVSLDTTSPALSKITEKEPEVREGSGEGIADSESSSEHEQDEDTSAASPEQAAVTPLSLNPEHADLLVPVATTSAVLPDAAKGRPEADAVTDRVAEESSDRSDPESVGRFLAKPQATEVVSDAVALPLSTPQQAESDSKLATEQVSPPVTKSPTSPQEAEMEQILESESEESLETESSELEPESDQDTASDANNPPRQACVEQAMLAPSPSPSDEQANPPPVVSREVASRQEMAEEGAAPAVADVGIEDTKHTLDSETMRDKAEVTGSLPTPINSQKAVIALSDDPHNPPAEPTSVTATHAARSAPETKPLVTLNDSPKDNVSEVADSPLASSHAGQTPTVPTRNDPRNLQTDLDTNTAGSTQQPEVLPVFKADEDEVEDSVDSGSDEESAENGGRRQPGTQVEEAPAVSIGHLRDLRIDPQAAGLVVPLRIEVPVHESKDFTADSGDDEDEDEDLESESENGEYAHIMDDQPSPPHSVATFSLFPSSEAPIALPQVSPLSLPLQPARAARPSLPYILTTRPTTQAQSLSSDPDELFSDCDQGDAITDRSRSLTPQSGGAASRARSLSRSSAGQRSPTSPRSPLQKLEHVLKSPFVRAGILADSSGDEDDDDEGRHYSDAEQGEDPDEPIPISRTPLRSSSPTLSRAPSPLPSLTLPLPYAPTHSRRPSLSVSTTGLFAPIDEALLPLSPPPTAPLSKLQRLEYALMSPINTLLHRENRGHSRRASDEGVADAIDRHGKPAIPRSRSRVGELIHYFSTLSAGQADEEDQFEQEDEGGATSASAHLLAQIRGDEEIGDYEIEPPEEYEAGAMDDIPDESPSQRVLAVEHPELVQSPLDISAVELPLPGEAVASEAGATELEVQAELPLPAVAVLSDAEATEREVQAQSPLPAEAVPSEAAGTELEMQSELPDEPPAKVDQEISRDVAIVNDSTAQPSLSKGSEADAIEFAAAVADVDESSSQQAESVATAALPAAEPVAGGVSASSTEPHAAAATVPAELLATDAPALSDKPASVAIALSRPVAAEAPALSDEPAAVAIALSKPVAADSPALSDKPAAVAIVLSKPVAADAPALSDEPNAVAIAAAKPVTADAPAFSDEPAAVTDPELYVERTAVTVSEVPAAPLAATVTASPAEPDVTGRNLPERGGAAVVPSEPIAPAAVPAEPVANHPVSTPAASVAEAATPKPPALAANGRPRKVSADPDCTYAKSASATAAGTASPCACLPHLRLRNAELRSELHHARLALTAALAAAAERAPPAWLAQVECAAAEAEAARAGRAMWDHAVEGEWERLREGRKGQRVAY
ncbi:hypothetical protein HDU87_008429 [Geranomyces variabilis]|uniref:Uncharacterized protein n=1 Tax=Geranomyces variabilis TaxID=109894 RepID=A0AAD5TDE4_9FUNG|nr:hypothetical protein HDU87_008429 [Geranomyces variabilis]